VEKENRRTQLLEKVRIERIAFKTRTAQATKSAATSRPSDGAMDDDEEERPIADPSSPAPSTTGSEEEWGGVGTDNEGDTPGVNGKVHLCNGVRGSAHNNKTGFALRRRARARDRSGDRDAEQGQNVRTLPSDRRGPAHGRLDHGTLDSDSADSAIRLDDDLPASDEGESTSDGASVRGRIRTPTTKLKSGADSGMPLSQTVHGDADGADNAHADDIDADTNLADAEDGEVDAANADAVHNNTGADIDREASDVDTQDGAFGGDDDGTADGCGNMLVSSKR
jgi:hypothetical protein